MHEIYIRLQSHTQESSNISLGQCHLKNWLKNQSSLETILIIFHKANARNGPHLQTTFLPPSPSIKSLQFRSANKPQISSEGCNSIRKSLWSGCRPCAAKHLTTMPYCLRSHETGSIVENRKWSLCTVKQIKHTGDNFSSNVKDKRPVQLDPKQIPKIRNEHCFQVMLNLALKFPALSIVGLVGCFWNKKWDFNTTVLCFRLQRTTCKFWTENTRSKHQITTSHDFKLFLVLKCLGPRKKPTTQQAIINLTNTFKTRWKGDREI